MPKQFIPLRRAVDEALHEIHLARLNDLPTKHVNALLKAASKEEAVEYTRRLLDHASQGTWEIYQLYEMPK